MLALLLPAGCRSEEPPPAVLEKGICEIPKDESALRQVCEKQRKTAATLLPDRREEEIGAYVGESCAVLVRCLSYGKEREKVTCYVADVFIDDMSQFCGYVCRDENGRLTKTPAEEVAEKTDALLLINADFLSARSWGLYVRGGEKVRDKGLGGFDLCLVDSDGKMTVTDSDGTTVKEIMERKDLYHVFSFGPSLLNGDGTPRDEDSDFHITDRYSKWNNYESSVGFPVPNPRTAVGQAADGHFIFMTVDGRMRGFSRGVTFPELSHMMYEEGASVAYNMDGGGSEIMIFRGKELTKQYSEDAKRIPGDYICIFTAPVDPLSDEKG